MGWAARLKLNEGNHTTKSYKNKLGTPAFGYVLIENRVWDNNLKTTIPNASYRLERETNYINPSIS